jgi:hypothetical protein
MKNISFINKLLFLSKDNLNEGLKLREMKVNSLSISLKLEMFSNEYMMKKV